MRKNTITGTNNISYPVPARISKHSAHVLPVFLIAAFFAVWVPANSALGQSGPHFSMDNPSFVEELEIKPQAAALADLNDDGHQDLILLQSDRRPQVWLYSKAANGFAEDHIHRLDTTYNNLKTLRIFNFDQETPQNELMIGVENIWTYESSQDTFVSRPVPQSIAGQSNVGDISLGDINNNGLIDAIISRDGGGFSKNFMYLNFLELNGQPSSRNPNTDIYESYHATSTSYLYHFNGDQYIDYFSIKNRNELNLPDQYFLGDPDGFKEQRTSQLHFGSDSYSAAVGDYNNDGHPDIYQTFYNINRDEHNRLFTNNGDGTFTKISRQNSEIFPVFDNLSSRNAMWGDYDNNGRLDLLVAEHNAGYNNHEPVNVSCSLYRNLGNGDFEKRSNEPVMIQPGNWTQAFFHDYNGDGKLDIITTGTSDRRRIQFYKNTTGDRNWLQLTLEQSNAFYADAVGARLELTATIDGQTRTQYREYNPYTGYHSQKPGYIHFGLDQATSAELTITWKSGQVTTHSFSEPELNRRHRITEPLAGKLTVDTDRSFEVLRAPVNESARDTLFYTNAGKAAIDIEQLSTSGPNTTIIDYTSTVPSGATGWIVIEFSPEQIAHLGPAKDTLTVTSNAINRNKQIPFDVDGLTERISFERVTSSGNPLINQSDSYDFATWLHLNADSQPDPLLVRREKNNQLFRSLTDSTYESWNDPLSNTGSTVNDIAAGYAPDNKGLALALSYPDRANELYIKDGDSGFSRYENDILSNLIKSTTSVSFHDFNTDGYMDLLFTNTSSQTNDVLLNERNGAYTLADAGDLTSVNNNTTSHIVADLDNKGRPEVVTTAANPNSSSGVSVFKAQTEDSLNYRSMQVPNLTNLPANLNQVLALDFNNDGLLDLLFLNDDTEEAVLLFENEGELSFSKVQNETINNLSGSFKDVTLLDYNLDGYVDLFFANEIYSEPNVLLETRGGNDFLQITTGELVSTTNRSTYGVGSLDYNQDGRPDLYATNNFGQNDLFLNNTGDNNWITVEVNGTTDRPNDSMMIPGARVQLETIINQDTLVQQRITGSSAAQSKRYGKVYFGMLNSENGKLKVTYPDGTTEIREVAQANRNYVFEKSLVSVETPRQPTASIPDPAAPELLPNYPNPFNATTHIRYYLPEAAPVQISIHSITGRKIQDWKFQRQQSGYHRITFEAENLSSGTYLVVFQSLNRRQTEKILLLK